MPAHGPPYDGQMSSRADLARSKRIRFARSQFVIGVLSATWMTAFLLLDRAVPMWTVWTTVPMCFAGMMLFRRSAWGGSALVVIACVICAVAGTPYGDIETLLPIMYLLALQGRHESSWTLGMLTLALLTAVTVFRAGAPWYAVLISLFVYGAAWVFGRIVRTRATAAAAAARESADVASIDLEHVLAEWSSTTRRRTTDESLAIVRAAVARMCALAQSAQQAGPPYSFVSVDAIRREGERAIARLHDTLTLLDGGRIATSTESTSTDAATQRTAEHARFGLPWALLARITGTVLLLALSVTVALVYGEGDRMLLIAAVVLPLCAGAVHLVPVVSGAAAAAALLVVGADPGFPPSALLPIGLCLAVLSWELVRAQRVRTRITMAVLFAAALFLGIRFGHQGVGFVCVLVALAVVAAAEWSLRDEILQTETARAVRLTAGIAAARAKVDRAERRQLARDLHDGVSHGITAMTLQASAAQTMADPERARRGMAVAIEVGEQTIREIDLLHAGRGVDDLGGSLGALVEGARTSGLAVVLRDDGRADALSYRIVQEALTNITRYAPGARVEIEVGVRGGRRVVRITDDGGAGRREQRASAPAQAMAQLGHGRGLRGLDERVRECEGRFHAGALHGPGGFEVQASWPAGVQDTAESADATAARAAQEESEA